MINSDTTTNWWKSFGYGWRNGAGTGIYLRWGAFPFCWVSASKNDPQSLSPYKNLQQQKKDETAPNLHTPVYARPPCAPVGRG